MAGTLYILIPPEADQPLHWLADNNTRTQYGTGPADSLPDLPGAKVVVILPGEHVRTHQLKQPGKWNTQTLHWALEEHLAMAPDQVSVFPLGRRSRDGFLNVVVIDTSWLAHWNNTLPNTLMITDVLPDYLMLPVTKEGESVFATEIQEQQCPECQRLLLRTGRYSGAVVPGPWQEHILKLAKENNSLLHWQPADYGQELLVQLASSGPRMVASKAFQSLGRAFPRRKKTRVAGWRALAALMVIAVVLQISLFAAETLQLKRQNQRLSAEIHTLFQQTAGRQARMVRPAVQLRQQLAALQGKRQQSSVISPLIELTQIWPEQKARMQSFTLSQRRLLADVVIAPENLESLNQKLAGHNAVQLISQQETDAGQLLVQLEVLP